MEEELGEAVPYWNWTEDDKVPDLYEGLKVPVRKGMDEECTCKPTGGRCGPSEHVQKNPDIKIDKENLRQNLTDAFKQLDFHKFQEKAMDAHNEIHISVGCELGAQATASYDPLFWLHHSFVDSQWAFYMELCKLRNGNCDGNLIEKSAWDDPMPPFNRRKLKNGFKNENERTLRHSTARATVDYEDNLCYKYEDLKFDDMSPEEFLENQNDGDELFALSEEDTDEIESGSDKPSAAKSASKKPQRGECGNVCKEVKGKKHCKELCTDVKSGAFVKTFVGVVLSKDSPSGVNAFDLCQDGECVKASHVSTFGINSKHADKPSEPRIDKENYKLTEVDVTAVMEKQGWTLKKDLTAKMTSTVMEGLPEPVVILKELGKGGKIVQSKVVLSPKEKRSHYGDLLEEYSKGSSKKESSKKHDKKAKRVRRA